MGMKMERYSFEKYTELYFYRFYSVGPKGSVRKLVCFQHYTDNPFKTFNLCFGDSDEHSIEIDDLTVTNNEDLRIVLQTVALIALEFLRYQKGAWISAKGSTPSRTRLYRIWILKFWDEINQYFTVLGYFNGRVIPFERGINYEGFLFILKKQ